MNDWDAGKFCLIADKREVRLTSEWSSHGDSWGMSPVVHFLFATAAHVPRAIKLSDRKAPKPTETCSPEYRTGANTRFWKMVNDTRQHLPRSIFNEETGTAWALFTTQSKPLPFESGNNVLPGMGAWARKNLGDLIYE